MKHIIILGDGMADHPVERLGGKTLLQYADTPYMDLLARKGKTGRLMTIPDGFHPGSEVANTSILGYDLNKVYEGRGPLEAASIGYNMSPEDLALRCNLITLSDGIIKNHHGGHLTTEEGTTLIKYLNEKLGNEYIQFIPGIQYRHLLIIKGGSKHIICAPPHDHPNEAWKPLLIKAENENKEDGRLSPQETANLLNELIIKSQELLTAHPFNLQRKDKQNDIANSIWPWGGGYRPQMRTLSEMFPQIHSGSVISAVDLIRGIGYYAGLEIIKVKGATGLANTNYEGKVEAALKQLREKDFVFLHIEASDEAGHDGDLQLKLQTIENLDHRAVEPIYNEVKKWDEPVCIAVLPDHPTPVEIRTHVKEPVPFLIWHPGITPDNVTQYDETSCVRGEYGLIYLQEFMHSLMEIK
ncbi:cofactor-independent phosphoglycerate mutase [Prevotella histicola]|jgi:proposed homoserine kinase|uniref:Putative homoserine kinase n=1 Tax=Prevotella histicola F0411 TaxID=857291 RepID=G6AEW6_9BACT|nr:cofactor-independent phosphoglycerate mutase [Prevotella histicola]EHG16813.1 putative homoserine kinase [Prevotella histicola F0411]MBF1403396.1 cofactor-independent phosphoglycerate mutase [Prevotella histicola]MBF1424951.1 cofactor-independent phosphoglycerate mutase [Prevotella histicola]MBW4710951.1 cofactor-independent phosphoglycerate mutase [Prevotella histicola]MBW4875787.1 cofactor-independent phosphoglycerate mutase [Prevotella histicola]